MGKEEVVNMETMSAMDTSEEDVLLPGFRFHPTDEELVGFYLQRKIAKKPLSIEFIKQIDIYKYDPWDLPKLTTVGDREWYFFCLRGRKYKNSIRPNRVTGFGFWKATGIDRPIYPSGERSNDCIGLKKSLVYYRGSAGKGKKTDWMMHEFRLPNEVKSSNHLITADTINQEAEIWTICRIFKRTVSYRKDWSDSSSVKKNSIDSSSKTCIFESDDNDRHLGSSIFQNSDKKPVINISDDKNQVIFSGQSFSTVQAPPTSNNLSFSSCSSNQFFREGNWDELGAVVEFATHDPAFVYNNCRVLPIDN